MAVGVADVYFAGVPRLVGGRPYALDIVGKAMLVNGVDITGP